MREGMRIAIIGAGAIGSLFAARLAKAGYAVTLVEKRAETVAAIQAGGLVLEDTGGSIIVHPQITGDTREVPPADLLVVCVKAYDTAAAMAQHRNLVGENTVVLTLQNGLGNVEAIGEVVGAEKVVAGVTTEGALLLAPGRVRHTGAGHTQIGEPSGAETPRLHAIKKVFSDAGFDISISPSVVKLIWSKLIINAGINALTAILKVENGAINDIEEAGKVARAAAIEAIAVAKASGIGLDEAAMIAEVFEVARRTARNRSSMLSDIVAGKPTEIDFIQGAIIKQAGVVGIDAPVNRTLLLLVKALETIKGTPGAD